MSARPWPSRRLGELASMGSGGTPPSKTARYYGGGIAWVSIADMTASGKYVRRTAKTLSADGLRVSAAKLYESDIVLYAMYASLGECAIAVGRVASSQAILGIQPRRDLDREYLYYYLLSVKSNIRAIGQQGTQSNLNATMVRNLRIPLPSRAEQRRISTALSSTDDLISSLERLITKRQAIKQGMMQELLTGRTRLPGFADSWSTYPFTEVMTRVNVKQYQVPASSYGEVGSVPVVDQGQKAIVGYTSNLDAAFDPGADGVVVFGDHTCITKFVNFPFAVGADGTQVVKAYAPNVTQFLAYALEYDPVISTGYNRHFSFLREKSFLLPPRDEQIAVVKVLNDVDAEIATLRIHLAKVRSIKVGMMQELLSGRTRLPVQGVAS